MRACSAPRCCWVRPLVVVLHGGLGSARRIEAGGEEQLLSLDAVADDCGEPIGSTLQIGSTPYTWRCSSMNAFTA
ncbi:MAG: hypothetical protein OSA97_04080 [Nevskia sp.]|nr:hypothetical protein [Nevskia sp.]